VLGLRWRATTALVAAGAVTGKTAMRTGSGELLGVCERETRRASASSKTAAGERMLLCRPGIPDRTRSPPGRELPAKTVVLSRRCPFTPAKRRGGNDSRGRDPKARRTVQNPGRGSSRGRLTAQILVSLRSRLKIHCGKTSVAHGSRGDGSEAREVRSGG